MKTVLVIARSYEEKQEKCGFGFPPKSAKEKRRGSQSRSTSPGVAPPPLAYLLLLGSGSKVGQEEPVPPAQAGVLKTTTNALCFLDGEKSTKEAVDQLMLDPNAVATANVLKGNPATRQFGEAAAYGVIIVVGKAN